MPEKIYVPHRKCIACRQVLPKEELLRIVLFEGKLKADPQNSLPGRGCYVCRNAECIRTSAEKNCFSRSFKKSFSKEMLSELAEEIRSYMN
ncbi:MAG: YlxR family protein [Firmicutes bacterium]|nr:YlxR family protein [Bacillota bacterium]